MHVAMACARFAPFTGGTETHVAEVAERLSKRGVTVTVLTTEVPGARGVELRNGVEIRRFSRLDSMGDLYIAPGIARAIDRGGFDLIHVQGVHTAVPLFALRAAQRRGTPTVLTFHTGGYSGWLRPRLRDTQWRLLRPYLRQVDRLVAVCEHEVELFSARLGIPRGQIRLIRNGTEAAQPSPDPPDVGGDPLILSVGRLEHYKGHHRVLGAMPSVLERAPGAHVGIVGSGPYERKLRRLVAKLGIDGAVTFCSYGFDHRDQLSALMASADVVALLSDYEAHPVSVLEAASLGVPIVVAEGSGLSELARDGLARSVPVDAAPSVVAKVLVEASLRTDSPALPWHDWDQCAGQLLELYGSLPRSA